MAILGDHPTGWAQAIAIHCTGGVATIGQYDAGRAIPGLHMHGVVFVEGAQVGVHLLNVLPGGWHQHAHCTEDIHAAHQQGLQHIVEAVGVGAGH